MTNPPSAVDEALAATLVPAPGPPRAPAAPGERDASRRPIVELDAPRIGRYVILREVGRGGIGVVYAGYDPQLDRKVAIKLLHLSRRGDHRRLAREAQGLARLSDPNVVQVYEIGEHEGAAFIAMEFVEGVTLDAWNEAARRTWSERLAVLIAAGRGLAAAHRKGLVHRDFKPENVMVDVDGRVRVMDFGLVHGGDAAADAAADEAAEREAVEATQARLASTSASAPVSESWRDRLTITGSLMGTPAYMSGEQFAGLPTNARSDQFSYCVTAWELLYGERPFAGEDLSEIFQAVSAGELREPPRTATVPTWVRRALERGLARDPAARWPDMDALLAALADDPRRRRALAVVTAALLLVTLVGIGLRAWLSERAEAEARAACAAEGAAIERLWSPELRAEIEAAFTASGQPFAAESWSRTREQIDAYTREWSTLRASTCVETRVEGRRDEASQRLIDGCLDDASVHLAATIGVLGDADARLVAHAARLPVNLPRLAACVDEVSLARRPAHLEHGESRAQRSALARASALAQVGDYAAALALAEEVAGQAAGTDRDQGGQAFEARARLVVGEVQRALGQLKAAEEAFERAFALAGEAGADETALRAATWLALLSGHDLARFDTGRAWGKVATTLMRRLGVETSADAATLAVVLGRVDTAAGDYPAARARYLEGLARFETALGPAHPDVTLALEALARLEDTVGDYDAALAVLERALAIREAAYGPHHSEVAALLALLGTVRADRGDLAEARELQTKALMIREAAFGRQHPDISESLFSLGLIDAFQSRFQPALARFEEALAIREATSGPSHPRVADLLTNISLAHAFLHHIDLALVAAERALAIQDATLGPSHAKRAPLLDNIGYYRIKQGRLDDAQTAFEGALRIREFNFGPESEQTAASIGSLGVLAEERGDLDGAIHHFERALAIQERSLGPEHYDLVSSIERLGVVRLRRGDHAGARALFERMLAIEARAGAAGSALAGTRMRLADALWAGGDKKAAREQIAAARAALGDADGSGKTEALDRWEAEHR